MTFKKQPWKAADATRYINEIANEKLCNIAFTGHARERMNQRSLIMSDLLFVCKNGFVYSDAEESTIEGYFKYQIEGQSPNSGSRFLKVVTIPECKPIGLKFVTCMWRDE
jgi:uncharacterized protein DUF4258